MALTGFLAQAAQGLQQNTGKVAPAPIAGPTPPQSPGFLGTVGNVMNATGNSVIDQVQSGANEIQSSLSGQGNPFVNGFKLLEGLSQGATAILAPAFRVITNALNDPKAIAKPGTVQNAYEQITNNPDYQKFAQSPRGQITAKALEIAARGANVAGTILGLEGGINEVRNPTVRVPVTETTPTTPEAQLQSRIQDATPAYSKDMPLTNIMNSEGKIVPRIAGEGGVSKFSNAPRVVTPSISEVSAGTEANNIPNYPDKGTALEKGLATQQAISTEAMNMRSGLQAEDTATPLDTVAEKTKVADMVKSNLPKDIQDKIGYIGKDNPLSKASSAPQTDLNKQYQAMMATEDNLPKTKIGEYSQKVLDAVKEYDGTREGKLDLKMQIDQAYQDARGKLAFGSEPRNLLDTTNTDIRNSLKQDLAGSTKNTDVLASLKKQTDLYNHLDVLREKAQVESSTNFGKLEQKYPSLKNLIRIAQRQGIYLPLRVIEAGAGITLIGKWLHDAIYNR